MKKIQILALGAIAILAASCNSGSVSTNVPLKSSADTLAYAYGTELAAKGLNQYLTQLGVLKDTAEVRFEYNFRIQAEADAAKKAGLEKELTSKLDSISKANNKNLADFISGIKDGMNSSEAKASYMRGLEVGGQLKQMSETFAKQIYGEDSKEQVNKDALLAGLVSVLKSEKLQVENAALIVENKMKEGQEKAMAEQEAKLRTEHAAEITAGEKFLAENKAKEGVVALPNGLQYKVIKEGKGAKPTLNDKVKVHYTGTLPDGTVFDSSIGKDPVVFPIGQVIKGWTEALQLMPVGSKWMLYIPYDLAYGPRGNGGDIKPFTPLVFEVELLSIEK